MTMAAPELPLWSVELPWRVSASQWSATQCTQNAKPMEPTATAGPAQARPTFAQRDAVRSSAIFGACAGIATAPGIPLTWPVHCCPSQYRSAAAAQGSGCQPGGAAGSRLTVGVVAGVAGVAAAGVAATGVAGGAAAEREATGGT